MASERPAPTIAIVIASVGRPAELGQWRSRIACQTRQPDAFVYSVVSEADLPPVAERVAGGRILFGAKGLPRQRNRGLDEVLGDHDVVAFFDDDYVPSRHCVAGLARLFGENPDIIASGGRLLADGINSAGIDYAEALRLLDGYDAAPPEGISIEEHGGGLYGCNMAYRTRAIGDTRFDEALPLYGWQEDVDFGARLRTRGRIVRSDAFVGVHQGIKGGRTSGVKLGYSQVANPIYLVRKGTMRASYSFKLILRNMLSNHARMLSPEPWVDRRGRTRGNWLALRDVLRRADHPMRILDLP